MARQRHKIRTHLTRLRGFSISFFQFCRYEKSGYLHRALNPLRALYYWAVE